MIKIKCRFCYLYTTLLSVPILADNGNIAIFFSVGEVKCYCQFFMAKVFCNPVVCLKFFLHKNVEIKNKKIKNCNDSAGTPLHVPL